MLDPSACPNWRELYIKKKKGRRNKSRKLTYTKKAN